MNTRGRQSNNQILSYINGEHTERVWTVENSSREAQIDVVRKFIDFALCEAARVNIDPRIYEAVERLKLLNKNPPPGFDKQEIFELKNYLKTFISVPTYGYNSSRYDLAIIFDDIIRTADEMGVKREDINVLKKGTSYFSLTIGKLHFKDLLNFTANMPLDRYLKTWTADCVKLLYPYEKFSNIEEIRAQIEFPGIEEFKSSLKPEVDEEVYEKCKNEYERRRSLAPGDPEKWENFEDYLKFYNMSDVKPASQALITQFETYLQNFGSYPNHFLGLPSFAKHVMFSMYDESCPSLFTFPSTSGATTLFREGIIGGLTNVYKRHVTLNEFEEAADAAKYSKRGNKWQKIEFYDINSMYPATFGEKFPCGLGFEWTLGHRNRLTKKLMTKRKVSMESLEWLDYMQQAN